MDYVDEMNAREAQKWASAEKFPTLNRITGALLKAARDRKEKEQAKGQRRSVESGRKRRMAEDSDSSDDERPRAKKSREAPKKSREAPAVDSEPESDDDSESGGKKSRYIKRKDCCLLTDYAIDIDMLRPIFQRMLLTRGGGEVRDGAVHRKLNFNAIMTAAQAALNRDNYKRFKKACMESFNDSKDV